MQKHPFLYEINTWVWLAGLSQTYQQKITLANVPAAVLDTLAGYDVIWLMGVWARSPHGVEVARTVPDLQRAYSALLPNWQLSDIAGSPYAVYRYAVDDHLGGNAGLAIFREALRARGVKLMLDYVPNHVATDHHWVSEQPDCLVQGTEADLRNRPGDFFRGAGGKIFAHGRDPYFPGWTDTVQINAFSPLARQITGQTLLALADLCDGLRCDMAMLLSNGVFSNTWGLPAPNSEYWPEVIGPVRARHPQFIFMAEVYWDMEYEMQRLGFDYTYDKRLYDRVLHEPLAATRDHLMANYDYQSKMARFVENHDEPRALTAFGESRLAMAATFTFTLPGLKLLYDGQLEGRRLKLPVQLGVAPHEPPQPEISNFYARLLAEARQPIYHEGAFAMLGLLPLPGESESSLAQSLIAYGWHLEGKWRVVVVNLSGQACRGRLLLADPALADGRWQTRLLFASNSPSDAPAQQATLPGADLLTSGLVVSVPAYSALVWAVQPDQAG
jgi:hypothetical protein